MHILVHFLFIDSAYSLVDYFANNVVLQFKQSLIYNLIQTVLKM